MPAKYFLDGFLGSLERTMQLPPFFAPRGSGKNRGYKYTAADCDCRYCVHAPKPRMSCGISMTDCPCFTERLENGCIPVWKAVVIIIAVIIAINITIIVIFGIVDFNSAKYKVTGESVIFVRDKFPEGILYKASQDPENEAYQWSIHDLLLALDSDMEDIVADYATKYESYVHYYQEEYANDEESLQAAIRPEWISTVGENGSKGYISAIDLEWPGWQISHEEALEIIDPYRGKYRAIPVFASDYSEIVDYFLMGIS